MRIGTFAVMAILVLAAPAAAQPSSTQKADELFNQGRDLLEAGKFKEACARFEASLEAADALGTRLNLALCMEKRGRIHTAMMKFEDTARRADREGQPDAAKVAREHADKLRPLIPTLTITTVPVPGQRVLISRPGEADVEVSDTSRPVAVDPTDPSDPADLITIQVQAPGYVAYSADPRAVAAKATDTIVIPELTRMLDPDPRPVPAPGKSRRKLYGIITGATGVALIGFSAFWANRSKGKLDDACEADPMLCRGGNDYSGSAKDHWVQLRYVSTGIFITGLAAVGIGAYLFFSAPKNGETTTTAIVPTVGPDGGGIAVLRHF